MKWLYKENWFCGFSVDVWSRYFYSYWRWPYV